MQSEHRVFQTVISPFNNCLSIFVSEAMVGMDQCSAKPAIMHNPLSVHPKNSGKGALILVGPKRTQFVAQYFRKHGNYSVHQINRCSPFDRLVVQERPWLQIVRHIGNVDPNLEEIVVQPLK